MRKWAYVPVIELSEDDIPKLDVYAESTLNIVIQEGSEKTTRNTEKRKKPNHFCTVVSVEWNDTDSPTVETIVNKAISDYNAKYPAAKQLGNRTMIAAKNDIDKLGKKAKKRN